MYIRACSFPLSFEVTTGMSSIAVPRPSCYWPGHEGKQTEGKGNGIQWTLWGQLEDLEFADDIVLLSRTHTQMQEETGREDTNCSKTWYNTNITQYNTNPQVIKIHSKTRPGTPRVRFFQFRFFFSIFRFFAGTGFSPWRAIGWFNTKARRSRLLCR